MRIWIALATGALVIAGCARPVQPSVETRGVNLGQGTGTPTQTAVEQSLENYRHGLNMVRKAALQQGDALNYDVEPDEENHEKKEGVLR